MLNFKQLLLEKGVKPFDKYEKWLPKLLHDHRFTAVSGQKERKALFEAFAKRIDGERRKQAAAAKKGGREGFRELLAKAESLGLFEDRTGPQALRALEQRFGEDDRWNAVPERERERLVVDVVDALTQRRKQEREKAQKDFRALILSVLRGREEEPPPWHVVRHRLEEDARWEAMGSLSERAYIYEQVLLELDTARRQRVRRQRQIEEEADVARKKRRLDEAEEGLLSFFAERVRAPHTTTWEEVLDALGDHKPMRGSSLDMVEKERIWEEYQRGVAETRRQELIQLLSRTSADVIGPEMEFREVMRHALSNPTAAKAFAGLPEEVLQAAWEEWRGRANDMAAEACRKWLQSCEHFRSTEGIDPADESGPAFGALVGRLAAADVRFRRLGARPEVQRRLVAERLRELRRLRESRGQQSIGEEDEI